MNEQVKRIIYDYKQSLGQQAFYAFDLLKEHVIEESAMKLVLVELDRVRELMLGDSLAPTNSSILEIEKKLSHEIIKANNEGDFTRVMEIEDDLTALKRVKSLISNE